MTTNSTYLKHWLEKYNLNGPEEFLWVQSRRIKDPTLRLLINNFQSASIAIQEYLKENYREELDLEDQRIQR